MSADTPPLDDRRAVIKAFFVAERGYWRPWVDTMLEAAPGFVEQYARYAGHPARTGPLSPRMVELVYVALDASSSHLFEPGLHTHLKKAFEVGASVADVLDVLQLVALQGAAHVGLATNIVADVAAAHGHRPPQPQTGARTDAQTATLGARIQQLAPSHALALEGLALWDPAYVAVLLDFVEKGGASGGLSPLERTLVQLALHACFTAFNPAAVRQLAQVALEQGAQTTELLQVVQLGAHLSVHGTALGAQVLRQVLPAT
jgi:alkylhydroperoxidase/carboxymuconolactone decarboxylase family protein YurZ